MYGCAALALSLGKSASHVVGFLEKAVGQPPDARGGLISADAAADLSALYIDRALTDDRPQDLFRALSSSLSALAIDPANETALFNEALALERLSLIEEARAVWSRYPGVEETERLSGWAMEARRHLHRLNDALAATPSTMVRERLDAAALSPDSRTLQVTVQAYPELSRLYAQQDLPISWAIATRQGRTSDAQRALVIARKIASACLQRSGDPMPSEDIATIERAMEGKHGHVDFLINGYLDYDKAMSAYEQFAPGSDLLFTISASELRGGGSSFALWAQLYRALCSYHAHAYDVAKARLAALRSQDQRFPNLVGRRLWLDGLIASIQGDAMRSLAAHAGAISCFKRTGEIGNEAAVHQQLSDVLFRLGQDPYAWRELGDGLRNLSTILEPRLRQGVLQNAAEAALRAGEVNAALLFDNAAVRVALRSRSSLRIALALRERASILGQLGKLSEARDDLGEAERHSRQVGDAGLTADVLMSRAKVLSEADPRQALTALVDAWPLLSKTEYVAEFAQFYLERGRLHMALGELGAAEADFAAGIDSIEAQRKILQADLRTAFLDQYRALFDGMLAVTAAGRRDASRELSFRYAERSRSRTLFDLVSASGRQQSLPTTVSTVSLADAKLLIPAHVTVIELVMLDRSILVWVIRNGSAYCTTLQIDGQRLERLIRHLGTSAQERAAREQFVHYLELLSNLLLQSLASLVPPKDTVIFVPDKCLSRIPFAALSDPATGRYLVLDHPVAVAPSASIYLRRLPHSGITRMSRPAVFVIGDPAFDRTLNPDLADLPLAAQEAREVAAMYLRDGRRTKLLIGQDATKDRVLAAAGDYEVLHFAGHAEVDENDPDFSRLLLAPTQHDSGVLLARDLYGRRFQRTNLVVLAGCGTGSGRISPSEGIMTLARPFLAGGVLNVVASLWAVEDSVTRRFSLQFHKNFMATGDAPGALRAAQLAMIADPDPTLNGPENWGAFVTVGGTQPSAN